MEEDTNNEDSGSDFENDVDDIYGTEDTSEEEEDPAQPSSQDSNKCSG